MEGALIGVAGVVGVSLATALFRLGSILGELRQVVHDLRGDVLTVGVAQAKTDDRLTSHLLENRRIGDPHL